MKWMEPKVDWKIKYNSDGIYEGDYFNSEDYNRIKNNLLFLKNFAERLYPEFKINDMGLDKVKSDYLYADEFNKIEENLELIAKNTANFQYGETKKYKANGKLFDFNELNRIERALLDMYNQLQNQYKSRRMFKFMLGKREVF